MPIPELSILVPVFNEAGNVVELHAELDRVLRDFAAGHELIFVDDGSTDGTAGLLARIQDGRPRSRPGRLPQEELRPDRRPLGRARPVEGVDPDPDGRRPPERPGRHPPTPGEAG